MKTYKFTLTTIAEIKAEDLKTAKKKHLNHLVSIHQVVYHNDDIQHFTYDSLTLETDDDEYDAEKIDYSRIE